MNRGLRARIWDGVKGTFDPKEHPHRIFTLLLILLAFSMRISILRVRYFDPDEFEHLHGAYCIHHGMLPYRDFFEHHTPMLHYILAFLYPMFGETIRLIFAARFLMWVMTGLIFLLTFALGRMMFDDDVGLISVLLLSFMIMFLEKSIEIRPDVGAVIFWLLSMILLLVAARRQNRRAYLWAGISLGISLMFTPKVLFPTLGVALGLIYQIVRYRISKARHLKLLASFALGYMIPVISTILYFGIQGGADDFMRCNFLMNLSWRVRFSPLGYLRRAVVQNPIFTFLGPIGMAMAGVNLARRESMLKADHLPLISTLVVSGSLFIIPVPYRQYYMLFWPFWAVYGAAAIWKALSLNRESFGDRRWIGWGIGMAIYLGFIIYLLWIRRWAEVHPTVLNSREIYPLMWLGIAIVSAMFALLKLPDDMRRGIIICLLSIGISAYPLDQMRAQLTQRNDNQLNDIRYIMSITSPNDAVQDGWSGKGVFRPHSYYYWFLHSEIRAMLTEKQLSDDLIAAMERAETKIVIYDGNLKALPEKFRKYVREKFEPTGRDDILIRKQ
ncbi:glycosyltransferase family 39 protein [Candidatus Poribacteria bacterium]|nr:glycosyltransferase family 39 protein [Candidatus Poribacteria bacterium]